MPGFGMAGADLHGLLFPPRLSALMGRVVELKAELLDETITLVADALRNRFKTRCDSRAE